MLIEIDLTDVHRGLGAGRRLVRYVGFNKGHLVCEDLLGNRVRVPRGLFTFRGVPGHQTRLGDDGRVQVKVGEEWRDLGQLGPNGRE